MCIYSNNKCMCVFLISPVPIAERLTSELIDTPVFHNSAPRPIKYRVSVPIPNSKTRTFSLTGCCEYRYICVYMISGKFYSNETLIKWLSEQFWRCCLCVYVLIETSRISVCVLKDNAHLCHPFIQRYDRVICVNAHQITLIKNYNNKNMSWESKSIHSISLHNEAH